ncbi:uncharacterized protein LOC135471564 [Liolophura sinensis]|uniref:uncharacterized protein LOC135471564 n=1 Tax=Liolophura sinensis TaxID=3198878 RepID=UPI0031580A55
MVVFGAILILGLIQGYLSQDVNQFDFFYTCHILADSNWRLTASINTYGNIVDRIFALDVDTGSEISSCSTDGGGPFITTQGNFSTFSIDIDSNTGVPTPECGVQQSPNGSLSDGQYRWKFEVTTDYLHSSVRLAYEKKYSIFCDFNNPDMTQSEVILAEFNITKETPPPVVTIQDPGRLTVVLHDNLSPVTVITTNDMMRLRADLNPNIAQGRNPPYTGISPYNCRVCTSTSCTTAIQLTDQNGCVLKVGGVDAFAGEPFTSSLSNNADGGLLYTGAFSPFTFSTSLNSDVSDVVFTCSFAYCDSSTGPATCLDRCTTLGPAGRKKRAVTDNTDDARDRFIREAGKQTEEGKKESYISVLIKVVSNYMKMNTDPVTGKFRKKESKQSLPLKRENTARCEGFQGFLIGVSIMGTTLLIALGICICLCIKLSTHRRQEQRNNTNLEDKKNSAFH